MEARWQCHIVAIHIRGLDNRIADAVPRNELATFRMLCPQTQPEAARIPGAKARLDKRQLDEAVESLLSRSVSASTLRTYKAGGRRFAEFKAGLGESPLPASEAHLCEFVAQLEADGLTHGTMKSYLAAVRHFHIRKGWGDPSQEWGTCQGWYRHCKE